MNNSAIVLTNGLLAEPAAKTAHGLIRGSDRFVIKALVDQKHAGKDAGEALDGKKRNIPIYSTLQEALAKTGAAENCIVGIAPKGGQLPDEMKPVVAEAIRNKMTIVSGLHDFLSERPDLKALADEHQVQIIDVRKPKDRKELHFWTGEIFNVKSPVVAVLGIETNLGKRTTTRMLRDACRAQGRSAEMIFTGQTGWMQDGKYGFILDSTINDFVAGELEHEIVRCYKESKPDVIFLEGQAGLRNPSGPCGSEYLISANAKQTVLLFNPTRKYFSDRPHWGSMPSVESEITLIRLYGSEVIALALNTLGIADKDAFKYQMDYEQRTGLPVVLPLQEGVERVIPLIGK
jgi:uncharacterized NAD-dependent epimerase/dehydratase family protein